MMRFGGTVQPIGVVDVSALVAWVTAIPFEDWPQQSRLEDGQIRPAMVNSPAWHGFERETYSVVYAVRWLLPTYLESTLRMLSVVMPGHSIPPHVDQQPPRCWGRVHVPLTSNDASVFTVDGEAHVLDVGHAYAVNTRREHSVSNAGETPRIHLMIDWEW